MNNDKRKEINEIVGDYKYGFVTKTKNVIDTGKGLNEDVVKMISKLKNEPEWMLEFRLKSFKKFKELDNPDFGPKLDFDFPFCQRGNCFSEKFAICLKKSITSFEVTLISDLILPFSLFPGQEQYFIRSFPESPFSPNDSSTKARTV